jgi:hypothetical protein
MSIRTTTAVFLAALLTALAALTAPAAARAATVPASVTIKGLDLHDGMIAHVGTRYIDYGTMYSCGNPAGSKLYEWGRANTPWCGFGYSTAPSLTGPWSPVQVLLSRWALDNWGPDKGKSWDYVCGHTGGGCFEPRMIERPDGVWILWFTAVPDWSQHHALSYYALGCNGPTGGCGYQAGKPHGSTSKPVLHQCANTNNDPDLVISGSSAYLFCSLGGALSEEKLQSNWVNGSGTGATDILPSASVEATGVYQNPDGTFTLIASDPRCGYCSGTTSAAGPVSTKAATWTAPSLLGPWTAGPVWDLPAGAGQPNTVITLGGQPWEYIDLWTRTGGSSLNQTHAATELVPLPGPFTGASAPPAAAQPAKPLPVSSPLP